MRLSKKRLAKHGKASCDFTSDTIPESLNAAIEGALEGATDAALVDGIFEDAAIRLSWIGYP